MAGKHFDRVWSAIEDELAAEHPLELEHAQRLAALGAGAVAPLIARLDDDDLRVVLTAGLALGRMPALADEIVSLLVPHLLDPHPVVAEHVRWALRELGPPAVPGLVDGYASERAHQAAIAGALACWGPRAALAASVLREDARDDAAIADALREIEGPWPDRPIDYLGETVRMDLEGPPPLAYFGVGLWLDILNWSGDMDESFWDRATMPEDELHLWRPDQIAFARPHVTIAAYHPDADDQMKKQVLHAADGERFTNQELLWGLLDAHHALAAVNDRIFEGMRLQADGSYYISTGS